jgi:hypothetical protein
MKSNLELVLAASGGKLFLSLAEVAQLTGWSVKTLRNRPEGRVGEVLPPLRGGQDSGSTRSSFCLPTCSGLRPETPKPACRTEL